MSVFEVGKTISESTGGHASTGGNSGAGNRFYFSDDAYAELGLQRGTVYEVRLRLKGATSAFTKLTMIGHRGYAPHAVGNQPFCYIVEALPQAMGSRLAFTSTVTGVATRSFEDGIEAQHLMGLAAGDFYPTVSCFQYTDYTEITLRVLNQSTTLKSSDNRANIADTTAADHSAALTKYYAGNENITIAGQAGEMGGDAIFFTAYIEGYSYNSTLSEGVFTTYNRHFGGRGVFLGASNPASDVMDYITIGANPTNATDFGELIETSSEGTTVSNGYRGIHFGGYKDSSAANDRIEYITFASVADSVDFSEMAVAVYNFAAGGSDGSRGIHSGGSSPPGTVNTIQYITIAINNAAIDFGDLSAGVNRISADFCGVSNGSRGMSTGGHNPTTDSAKTTMEYITIGVIGNSIDFGDLSIASLNGFAFDDSSRACVAHARPVSTYLDSIDHYNIGTTGNASDFGNLSQARARAGAVSDGSRGCFGAGAHLPTHATTDTIDYAVIGNTGNMTDFGNLTVARQYVCATAGD